MKKLALLFCGLGAMLACSLSSTVYASPQPEPQYQEQTQPVPCLPDTVCNQLPCNTPVNAPCTPAPCTTTQEPCYQAAPCNTPVPCDQPAPCNTPVQVNQTPDSAPAQANNAVYCGGC